MYVFDQMLGLGLKDDQEFPTLVHEQIAKNLALCNPAVRDRDTLTAIVQYVLTIPDENVFSLTLDQIPEDVQAAIGI